MTYEGELRLLCETFRKSRVPVTFLTPEDSVDLLLDESFALLFGRLEEVSVRSLLERIEENTIYRMHTTPELQFFFLQLPRSQRLLVIGPYVAAQPSQSKRFEIAERCRIPPHHLRLLDSFYGNLAVIPEGSHLMLLLDAFGECIWGSNAYAVLDVQEGFVLRNEEIPTRPKQEADELLMNMKFMEQRYAVENELLRAVTHGQIHKGDGLMATFSTMPFEKRLDDPLRNLKNYSIIMNTLLRKAAEKGGVHPYYINEISSDFARRIEQLSSVHGVQQLMVQMFRSYCTLVRKHRSEQYSPSVRKAILLIGADLSADLSLHTLAEALTLSPAYFSDLFRRETGQTLTHYINEQRMLLAAELLDSTALQIQTIAQHCGVLDVQYFSKLFKKHIGMTPKEYRKRSR